MKSPMLLATRPRPEPRSRVIRPPLTLRTPLGVPWLLAGDFSSARGSTAVGDGLTLVLLVEYRRSNITSKGRR